MSDYDRWLERVGVNDPPRKPRDSGYEYEYDERVGLRNPKEFQIMSEIARCRKLRKKLEKVSTPLPLP